MAIHLLIRDGNPDWWSSPDIWVVPGSDPTGPPGSPIAGKPAYLWAHVANTGGTDAGGVRVDFFWANPALQVLRSTATFVGSAIADVPAGGAQDVLCLVPWTPIIVNGGHECVVAVANDAADDTPLPDPPPDDFNPPAWDQVAQRNLTVFDSSMHGFPLPLIISGFRRGDKSVEVVVETGGVVDELSLERLGLRGLRPTKKGSVQAGLSREPKCIGEKDPLGPSHVAFKVPQGTTAAVYAAVRSNKLPKNEYGVVRVVEKVGEKTLGGFTMVIVQKGKE